MYRKVNLKFFYFFVFFASSNVWFSGGMMSFLFLCDDHHISHHVVMIFSIHHLLKSLIFAVFIRIAEKRVFTNGQMNISSLYVRLRQYFFHFNYLTAFTRFALLF
jgi:hypothetical protein